jgi:hypothetical protein
LAASSGASTRELMHRMGPPQSFETALAGTEVGRSLLAGGITSWPRREMIMIGAVIDRRALTEMLVDKIIIERHPSKIDKDGRRHYLIRAIPYQDPQQEAERLKAVHEARVKIVPRV